MIDEMTKEVIKDKLTNGFYVNLIFFSVIVHWKFFITLFFVSGEDLYKTKSVLKTDYLHTLLWDSNNFWYSLGVWVLPFLLTVLAIFILPKYVFKHTYSAEAENEFAKRKIRSDIQDRVLKQEVAVLDSTIEKNQKESELMITWSRDFELFKNSKWFKSFATIISIFYNNQGYFDTSSIAERNRSTKFVAVDAVAYYDSNGIISVVGPNKLDFTDKGRFFIRKFQG